MAFEVVKSYAFQASSWICMGLGIESDLRKYRCRLGLGIGGSAFALLVFCLLCFIMPHLFSLFVSTWPGVQRLGPLQLVF